ncbi:hypothetical protein B2G71_08910 [Novosphingobium sp. PC22D]|nr:hypothetical protein B2G71_08910 [Novosphingobium sp. PC22D]
MLDANAPILIATDLSARSDRAVDRAIMLGRQSGCPVRVAHVLDPDGHETMDPEAIEARVRQVLPDDAGAVEIALLHGSPPSALAAEAERIGARLIVAGVARYNQVTDYLLGTAIDYLLRKASVPVLVVKQRPKAPYRRILLPVDLSAASRQALLVACAMFPDARIIAVHAFHVGYEGLRAPSHTLEETRSENEAELTAFLASPELAEIKGRVETRAMKGGTEQCVADAIDEYGPDLVVLGTHGSGSLRHLTIGSKANTMLSWIAVDTMVVRADG